MRRRGCRRRREKRRCKKKLRRLKTRISTKRRRVLSEPEEPETISRKPSGRRIEQGLDRPRGERPGPVSHHPGRDQESDTRRQDKPPARDRNQQRQTSRKVRT